MFSAKAGQESEGGVTGVDSVLILLLSSVERCLLSGNESFLLGNFSLESGKLGTSTLDVTLSGF